MRIMEYDEPTAERAAAFEEILDRALNSREMARELARPARAADRARLRASALRGKGAIEAAAAAEYAAYQEAKEHAAQRAPGLAQGVDETPAPFSRTRDGILPALAIVVPALSGIASVVFLVWGFVMSAVDGRHYVGGGLLTAGVVCACVAVGAAVGDLAWLLSAAARNRPVAEGTPSVAEDAEVGAARDAWERALLERGMLPFLRDGLGDPPLSHP
ncbi:hypothetical protein ACQB60_24110 [Actinomycetota bacterium Odt1-20B]